MTTELTEEGRSRCRFCASPLQHTFADLGTTPLCQKHVEPGERLQAEPFYELHAYVCVECFLVQVDEVVPPTEIFGDGEYAYFSSYSSSWLKHAELYAADMVDRLGLDGDSLVVEVASNDGYLLQNFQARGIPVLGIEPASNTAAAAREKGIDSLCEFFGVETARRVRSERGGADLLLGNNVLAHVPDLNDFVAGLKVSLGPQGTITMEFPHLLQLVEQNQFDTIYHEHFSYLSFGTVCRIFAHHGLTMVDVDELSTHGGSLRIYAKHVDAEDATVAPSVAALLDKERKAGMLSVEYYSRFNEKVKETKRGLLEFLIGAKREGKRIAGYGAPGKGNTLLNYCGIRNDFIDFTVDRSPHKQGNLLPGTRIPILAPEAIFEHKPDYVLILPWNLRDEIVAQMSGVREWGGKFVVPIPAVQVID